MDFDPHPRPFVVAYPCLACRDGSAIEQAACASCLGTGVGRFFHGTKAELQPGALLTAGQTPNFGDRERMQPYVYLTGTLDAAIWGAELAVGDGPGRVYVVEPTGEIVDDPNLTNKRYPGNPSKSYRSAEPLRVIREVSNWRGHDPEVLEAMRSSVERSRQQGIEPID